MKFYDMNGIEINVGDCVEPIEGPIHRIVSIGKIDEFPNDVMFGQQLENMAAFAILTAENLKAQFKKIEG